MTEIVGTIGFWRFVSNQSHIRFVEMRDWDGLGVLQTRHTDPSGQSPRSDTHLWCRKLHVAFPEGLAIESVALERDWRDEAEQEVFAKQSFHQLCKHLKPKEYR